MCNEYSAKVKTLGVIARPFGPWQSPAFERFEIAASAFGLLAMTVLEFHFLLAACCESGEVLAMTNSLQTNRSKVNMNTNS